MKILYACLAGAFFSASFVTPKGWLWFFIAGISSAFVWLSK